MKFLALLPIAPLAFYYPYHTAISAVALFGVWHIVSELDFLYERYGFMRRRKQFRPMIMLGAAVFTAAGLPLLFSEFKNERNMRVFQICFALGLSLWLFASVWRRGLHGHLKLSLLMVCALLPLLAVNNPLLLAFLFIHLHNVVPWLFYWRKTRGISPVIHAGFWGLIFPVAVFAGLLFLRQSAAAQKIDFTLERDLFQHVVPELWPWENPLLLLSFFAYQQAVHYLLWILVIPAPRQREFGRYFSDLAFFAGFSRPSPRWPRLTALTAIALSLALFILDTVDWRKIYFAFAQFHVLVELPLIWLATHDGPGNRSP